MKFLLLLVMSLYAYSSFALTCSKLGSTVLWVNGINTDFEKATKDLVSLQLNSSSNQIDSKNLEYQLSYNFKQGFQNDLFESIAQKLSLQFNLSIEKAFVATYISSAFPSFAVAQIKALLPEWANDNLQAYYDNIFGTPASEILSYAGNAFAQWENLNYVSTDLKSKISQALLSGRKLILGSHSQGNLFIARAIQDFIDGEQLSIPGKNGTFSNFTRYVSHLSVASPVNSPVSKIKYVLNDKDIINSVFFGAPASNFDLETSFPDPRDWTDIGINHYFDQTYLNSKNHTATGPTSLMQLKAKTLQAFVDAAELLESNCPIADFKFQMDPTNNLKAVFDASESINTKNLIYKWSFGNVPNSETTELDTIEHTFPIAASYTVKLEITDSAGTDFGELAEKQITVNLPYPSFYSFGSNRVPVSLPYEPNLLHRDLFIYPVPSDLVSLSWNVEGITYQGTSIRHLFSTPGVHPVDVKITFSNGRIYLETLQIRTDFKQVEQAQNFFE